MTEKTQIRRSRDEVYVKVLVSIPKRVLDDSKKIAALHYPDIYYNFSHYVTAALLRQNRRYEQ